MDRKGQRTHGKQGREFKSALTLCSTASRWRVWIPFLNVTGTHPGWLRVYYSCASFAQQSTSSNRYRHGFWCCLHSWLLYGAFTELLWSMSLQFPTDIYIFKHSLLKHLFRPSMPSSGNFNCTVGSLSKLRDHFSGILPILFFSASFSLGFILNGLYSGSLIFSSSSSNLLLSACNAVSYQAC